MLKLRLENYPCNHQGEKSLNTRPVSIILQQQPDQGGGGWEVIAVYPGDEQETQATLATFSPFLNRKLVQELAALIARSQGLSEFEQGHE